MARRKQLKGIACALAGSFNSRYNDVEGYWAMGKLLRLARKAKVPEVELDLLYGTMSPYEPQFEGMVQRFTDSLQQRLGKAALSSEHVALAMVKISFGPHKEFKSWSSYVCTVAINDDLGHEHKCQVGGSCRPHNPARESRSTRVRQQQSHVKKKLRTLKVGSEEYHWRVAQAYERTGIETDPYRSITTLTEYSGQARSCRLVVTFVSWEDSAGGNPLYTGMPIRRDVDGGARINLNQPKFVRQIVDHAIDSGQWNSTQANTICQLDQGMDLLSEIGYDVFEA